MTLRMADMAGAGTWPPGMDVLAGYVNYTAGGHTATWPSARNEAKLRGIAALSITTLAGMPADILDMEQGAASYSAAPGWWGLCTRPVPIYYMGVRFVDGVVASLAAAGHPRNAYKLLSAHYGAGVHICGPTTCGWCQTPCDGTQWAGTVAGPGGKYDESALRTGFLALPAEGTDDMRWGIVTHTWTAPTGKVIPAIWAVIPTPTGLRRAHVPHPADVAALKAMGAVTAIFAADTIAAMPAVTL